MGWRRRRRSLALTRRFFADQGYRVLVPDLRGHGRSKISGPVRYEDFSITGMAADLEAVLAHAGIEACHWVGNSLGGILGLDLMARRPELFLSFASFGTAHRLNLPPQVGLAIRLPYGVLGRELTGRLTGYFTTRNPAARPLVSRIIADFDPAAGAAVASHVARYDLTASAMAFEGPMLLLRGQFDTQVNGALETSLPALNGKPGFSIVELPTGGHCANLDATDEWRAALLNFWRDVRPSAPASSPAAMRQ